MSLPATTEQGRDISGPAVKKTERPFINPGWHRDLSNDDYHGSNGYGSTTLKKLNEMPFSKMDYQRKHQPPPSDAMQLGSAVHVMTLEPHLVDREIAKLPDGLNLRTKADREYKQQFLLQNEDKIVLTAAQYQHAEAMAESVRQHPQVKLYLNEGFAEQSIYYWYNPEDWDERNDYRIMCKVRPDWVATGHNVVFDLKTTRNAAFSEFMRSCKTLGYHMSAAMYLDGVNRSAEFKDFVGVHQFNKFVWLCVENEPPYEVAAYEISSEDYKDGLLLYHSAVRRLYEYQKSEWKGYGEFDGKEFQPITRMSEIPKYGNKIV